MMRLLTWLSAVRIAAVVLRDPNHASTFNFRFPVSSSVISMKSRFKCLKLRVRVPRGPLTSMILAFTLISMPSGMSIVSDDKIVFIVANGW
ncbi:hypothetical protein Hanom_Chr11g01063171 [Helianthus anomalus]